MKVSIVNFSQVKSSINFRIDSDYYRDDYLKIYERVKTKNNIPLGKLIETLTDYHANGSYEILKAHVDLLDEKSYALMIRTVDFEREDFENNVKYITYDAYNFLKKTKLFGEEVIINKIGNAGKAYLVPPLNKKISLGMNQFMIRTSSNLDSYYLYAYLISRFGKMLVEQRITGAVPLSIDKDSVRSIPIVVPSKKLQETTHKIISMRFEMSSKYKNAYQKAENLLLEQLNIRPLNNLQHLTFTKNSSDVFNANRIDAEYFQPKYEEIIKTIELNQGKKLDDIVSIKKSLEVGSETYAEKGIPFIRVSNLSMFGITNNNQQYISEALYTELEKHQPHKGEILLSKDATPGVAYYLGKEPEKMIVSGGIVRLSLKDKNILPEYLELVLNSIVVKKQIERDCAGSVIIHWLVDQIKNTLIPVLDYKIQEEIRDLVKESFKLREESNNLLEIAKNGVEKAIEENEEIAIQWIENQVSKLNIAL